jgi:hypothetical protein
MNGEILGKKRGPIPFWNGPRTRKEGYEERWLRGLFFQIIDKLLVGLTFLDQLTFSPTYFDMDLWTSLPFIASKITHL